MASLRSRVTAMPCCLFSSMQPTTTAPPYWREQGSHLLEALLAVLQVDRVDDRLALAVAQRHLDHGGVGGVDHERDLDPAGQLAHEAVHVGGLVAVGVGQADVEHLGARLDLGAADLGRLLEALGDDQLLELAASR